MASLRTLAAAALLFLSAANAHFVLVNPPSLEGNNLDDEKEGNAPCGALVPDLSQNTTNTFRADGDFVAIRAGHQQNNWLIRGTLEDKAAGNWTQLYPIFSQSGLGNLCQTSVSVPKEWIGKRGVIGVVANAPDGVLYQCSVVNFVAGSNTPGSSCTNSSTVTASFTSDSTLSGLVGNPSPAPSGGSAPKPPGSAASTQGFPLGNAILAMAMVVAGTTLF